MTEKKEVSRVKITTKTIKKSYGKISNFYATLEGMAEKGERKKGLKLQHHVQEVSAIDWWLGCHGYR